MVKTVKWNKTSLRKLRETVQYLQTEVSDKAANNFVDAVYHQIANFFDTRQNPKKRPY
jgi:hypothetical protein